MTFSKEVTQHIVHMWGLGLTAEETLKGLKEQYEIIMSLHTVYNKRNSITAQQMIDEIQREQQRDIAKEQNSEVRMRYRDKLLDKLLPHKIQTDQNVNVTGMDEGIQQLIKFSQQPDDSNGS